MTNEESPGGDWPEIIDDTGDSRGTDLPVTTSGPPRSGDLPALANPGIPLNPQEIVHCVFPQVGVYQRRVVGQKYVGVSTGVTLFGSDAAFSFAQSEGRVTNQWRDVRLAHGHLILTSQRLVLWAAQGGFQLFWQHVLSFSNCTGGVALTHAAAGPGEPPIVLSTWYPRALVEWLYACWFRANGR